jgi:SnoaL-like domain
MTAPTINPNAAEMAAEHPCDTSHCTTDFATLLQSYMQAKCDHDFTAMRRHLHPSKVTFGDAVSGWVYRTPAELEAAWGVQVTMWPAGARFYNTQVIGGDHGGVVFGTDTAEMMGTEIRGIAVVDLEDGAISRWIDYWDPRPLGSERATAVRTEALPDYLGEHTLAPSSPARIHEISAALQDALSAHDADRAGALFSPDAVFEDHTLRTAVRGRAAITTYLHRAGPKLPYGTRAVLRHAVGGDLGGGYEWRSDTPAGVGVNALALDASGAITYFAAMWDGGSLDDETLSSLAALAVVPWSPS